MSADEERAWPYSDPRGAVISDHRVGYDETTRRFVGEVYVTVPKWIETESGWVSYELAQDLYPEAMVLYTESGHYFPHGICHCRACDRYYSEAVEAAAVAEQNKVWEATKHRKGSDAAVSDVPVNPCKLAKKADIRDNRAQLTQAHGPRDHHPASSSVRNPYKFPPRPSSWEKRKPTQGSAQGSNQKKVAVVPAKLLAPIFTEQPQKKPRKTKTVLTLKPFTGMKADPNELKPLTLVSPSPKKKVQETKEASEHDGDDSRKAKPVPDQDVFSGLSDDAILSIPDEVFLKHCNDDKKLPAVQEDIKTTVYKRQPDGGATSEPLPQILPNPKQSVSGSEANRLPCPGTPKSKAISKW